jgi:hypothetical protein
MNRRTILDWTAGGSIGLCALAIVLACSLQAADQRSSVQVAQLIDRPPIGSIGKPLGTRVVVEGHRAEGVLLANPLAVEKVDGEPLKEKAKLELKHIEQLKPHDRYVLEGYESGSFVGEPDWLNKQVQQTFQYRPSFVVRGVVETNK